MTRTRARSPKGLHLGEGLTLPDRFATEAVMVFGVRGSGKSNTIVRWAEVLYAAGIPWVAIDPKGDWGGIRSSADGKAPGLAVPVFGGAAGTFPLTEDMGAAIADLLVDLNLSAVLDVSGLSIAARARFLTTFARQLTVRHKTDPHARCVILEEAHRYVPQAVTAELAACKEAVAAILLEGRAWGLGCWAVSQRPARLHKDVVEQADTVIVHRLGAAATNDRRTVTGWVDGLELAGEIAGSLTRLGPGEAWVVAPSFDICQRVTVDRRTTYDSGATPLVGAGRRRTLTLAEVDTDAITVALAGAIEQAQANDPRQLHRRIADLERQLEQAQAAAAAVPAPLEIEVEVPVLSAEVRAELGDRLGPLADVLVEVRDLLAAATPPATERAPAPAAPPPTPEARPAPAARPAPRPVTSAPASGVVLTKAERAILTVLVQHPDGRTKVQLALLTGYSAKSSGLRNALGSLRSGGLITKNGEPIQATPAGIAALGPYDPLPTGPALFAHWLAQLSRAERAVLEAMAAVWPNELDRDALATATGYSAASSGLRNALGRLRSLELVDGWRASDDLMEATR